MQVEQSKVAIIIQYIQETFGIVTSDLLFYTKEIHYSILYTLQYV